jgi:hypothetical protein
MKQKAKDWGEEWEGMAAVFEGEDEAKEAESQTT